MKEIRESWKNSQKRPWSEGKSSRRLERRPSTKESKPEVSEDETSKSSSSKGKSKDDHSVPQPLPRDQSRKDKDRRTMTRKCHFCDRWHFDFDCPKAPASYSVNIISMGSLNQSLEDPTDTNASMSDSDSPNSDSSSSSSQSNHNMMESGRIQSTKRRSLSSAKQQTLNVGSLFLLLISLPLYFFCVSNVVLWCG